jgi:hypothetical protein
MQEDFNVSLSVVAPKASGMSPLLLFASNLLGYLSAGAKALQDTGPTLQQCNVSEHVSGHT